MAATPDNLMSALHRTARLKMHHIAMLVDESDYGRASMYLQKYCAVAAGTFGFATRLLRRASSSPAERTMRIPTAAAERGHTSGKPMAWPPSPPQDPAPLHPHHPHARLSARWRVATLSPTAQAVPVPTDECDASLLSAGSGVLRKKPVTRMMASTCFSRAQQCRQYPGRPMDLCPTIR
jgi:hypothetical protein